MSEPMSFDEFSARFVPTVTRKRRAVSFEQWAREKGLQGIQDATTLKIEILLGSLAPMSRFVRGQINSQMETVRTLEQLHREYCIEIPETEETRPLNNDSEQARAKTRVAYKRYLKGLEYKNG